MRALLDGKWVEGYLDYHRAPGEYRIQVLGWKNLERLHDLYFARPRSLRMVWNYLREVGPRGVLRRIVSRTRERYRNEKSFSCGIGRIVEPAEEGVLFESALVVFLAPCHPPCVERITLPGELVTSVEQGEVEIPLDSRAIFYLESLPAEGNERWWAGLEGWSRYSGESIRREQVRGALRQAVEELRRSDWARARRLPVESVTRVAEVVEPTARPRADGRPRAVLFGYGHYAKIYVLPNVEPFLRVDCIHEIDPTQIPRDKDVALGWDTSPGFREGEHYDAALIAGYHHTHTPLAVAALRQGAYAVVEKPVVVDGIQLAELLAVVERTPKLFSCFHKRYLDFNDRVFQDLGIRRGEPVSYHCIVYEVPLPRLHWYRWPNSKSRLVSNGCHWIDHFLFLNDFAPARSWDLVEAPEGTLNGSVVLENGAFFTMVLTDRGSERIGVQDYIELRAHRTTVRMINGAEYQAEGPDRILHRERVSKLRSYERMYREIGRRIRAGAPGDSARSLEVSAGLILALEERLRELRGATPASAQARPLHPLFTNVKG